MDDVPDFEELLPHLRHPAEDVCIVLRERANAGEPRELTGLLVAIAGGRVRVALGKFAVAPELACINLRVVRTIHRLHCKLVALTGCDAEEFVLELVPVTGCLVELFLRDVRYLDAVVAGLAAETPHKLVEKIPHEGAPRRPERESRTDELREGEEVELLSKLLVVALFCFF